MDDKNLFEEDIIDLTDLLQEGQPTEKSKQAEAKKKVVTEPDSFDLGKEISMDYDVSIEEIEQDATVLSKEEPLNLSEETMIEPSKKDSTGSLLEKPLGELESELDKVMNEKFDDVSLTSKEEEALLSDEPLIEEQQPVKLEKEDIVIENIETDEPIAQDIKIDEMPMPVLKPDVEQEPLGVKAEPPKVGIPVDMPTEAILDAVISEFKKEMPALLEGIIRPVLKELIQEIISSTRQVIPGLVESVIKEEIEKLKKV